LPRRVGGDGLGGPIGALDGDAQIGNIFRNMRAATRLSREAVARRLATTRTTVEDLEMGAVSSLPHWRETDRIVRSYCKLLRLDPEPLLWRIQRLLQAGGTRDNPPTHPPARLPALRKERPQARAPRQNGHGVRKVLILGGPPVVVALLFYWASMAPAPFYRAISLLPASWEGPARAGLDSFVLYCAPRQDGLRWIDVGNPRLRKVDKLQTTPR
jgi:hypothetical protein